MKRLLLALILLTLAFLPALAEDTENAAILSALQESCPGLQTAVTDSWGNAAAAVFEYEGAKILCILEKTEGEWRVTIQNPHVLVQEEPLPALLMDTDDALFWTYDAYPRVVYSVHKSGGVWGGIIQMAQTTSGDGETMEDEVFYQDGEIVHNWYHFDENENMLHHTTERMPAPWLADCANLTDFELSRFPVIGAVEYDGEWPSRAFIEQGAKYLMPDYTFVSGSFSSGRLRFLMDKPDGTRVFVGCGTGKNPALVESSPLPKSTHYGVENFTNSLNVNGLCVSLAPSDTNGEIWGISFIMPYDEGTDELNFGPSCAYMYAYDKTQICFGGNPWSDITKTDWNTLPKSFQEAADAMDGDGWALVSNPNPADRLHLRTSADTGSKSLGKYYNGTPVRVLETKADWVKAEVFGRTGWMLKKYLSFTQPCVTTLSAMPQMQIKNGTVRLYASPDDLTAYQEISDSYGMFVVGILGDEWYHVWFPGTGVSGFIRQSGLFPGNG